MHVFICRYLLFSKLIMSAKRKQCLPVAVQLCSWQEACQVSRSLHKDMATAFPALDRAYVCCRDTHLVAAWALCCSSCS